MGSVFQKYLVPEQAADRGQGVREGRFGLVIPGALANGRMVMPHLARKDQADHAEQAQQIEEKGSGTFFRVLRRASAPATRPSLFFLLFTCSTAQLSRAAPRPPPLA